MRGSVVQQYSNNCPQPFWHRGPALWWRQFFHGPGGGKDGFRIIQVHYIYCALYFCFYYIRPTSDNQALDRGLWTPALIDLQLSVMFPQESRVSVPQNCLFNNVYICSKDLLTLLSYIEGSQFSLLLMYLLHLIWGN